MANAPKILYVDDEEDLVILAQSFFEDENLMIDISTDFDQALDKIHAGNYDIVITDAKMPKGSGQELVKRVRIAQKFAGKFILVTGNIDPDDSDSQSGFDMVIYKPIHFQDLVEKVKQLLKTLNEIPVK
jgi:DNA-binding response OmpR family regulator